MTDEGDIALHQIKQDFLKFIEHIHLEHGYDLDYRSLAQKLNIEVQHGNSNQAVTRDQRRWIIIDPSVSESRQRFTGLHEVSHHLFEMAEDEYLRVRLRDIFFNQPQTAQHYEEELCDAAAALLLMPTPMLREVLDRKGYGPLAALELVENSGASVQAAARRVTWAHEFPTFVFLVNRSRWVVDCFSHGHTKQYPVASGFAIEPDHELFRLELPRDRHEHFEAAIPFKSGGRTWKMQVRATLDSQGRSLAFFNNSDTLPLRSQAQSGLFD